MIINAISGFSASSRKQSDTLAGFLYFASMPGSAERSLLFHNSANSDCVKNSLRKIHRDHTYLKYDTLLLIGKSLGAVRTWWLAYNHWDEIKHFKKIRIVLIDPHGWQRGDGRWGSYGRKMLNGKWRNLGFNNAWWGHKDFEIVNIFQRNDYPSGAMLLSTGWDYELWDLIAQNIKLPSGANHWNCTDINTETGQYVAGVIRDTIEGLE